MNVAIQIQYKTDLEIKVTQRGSFPPRGRKLEQVAYDWWLQLKKEMQVEIELEKVIINGEDFTDKVKGLEKTSVSKRNDFPHWEK